MGVSASLLSQQSVKKVLSSAVLRVGGVQHRVLVDTGCSRCVAHVSCCSMWTKSALYLITLNSGKWQCEGMSELRLQLRNGATADVSVCMTTQILLGFSFILGMDGIRALGGVTVGP